jgi:hypothetical protein
MGVMAPPASKLGSERRGPRGKPGPKPHSNDLFRKRPYFLLGLVAERGGARQLTPQFGLRVLRV